MVKAGPVGYVVAKDEAVRSSEEVGGEGAESLLARRVPKLETHRRALDLDHLVAVVDANGGDEFGRKDILVESEDEGGLAAGGISDHQQPDDVGALGPHLERARRTGTSTLLRRHTFKL